MQATSWAGDSVVTDAIVLICFDKFVLGGDAIPASAAIVLQRLFVQRAVASSAVRSPASSGLRHAAVPTYAWLDGLDVNDPVLIPLANATQTSSATSSPLPRQMTLSSYAADHPDAFDRVARFALARELNCSPLLLVRAAEVLRIDAQAGNAAEAFEVAIAWSRLLRRLCRPNEA